LLIPDCPIVFQQERVNCDKIQNLRPKFQHLLKKKSMSWLVQLVAEIKISADPSRVTGPAELNEMVQ
jgi:hypothetical protein